MPPEKVCPTLVIESGGSRLNYWFNLNAIAAATTIINYISINDTTATVVAAVGDSEVLQPFSSLLCSSIVKD
jgi:hypothetical protein